MRRILVVDDDSSVTESLEILLRRGGFDPVVSHAPDDALDALRCGPIDLDV